jgi:transposase
MKAVPADAAVYVWQGAADMRAGFERLAALVHEHMQASVLAGGVYVFVSRCRKRVKLLYWDNDGYALWYKRLEAGAFRVEHRAGVEVITGVDLQELLTGMDLSRIRMKKNAENGLFEAA